MVASKLSATVWIKPWSGLPNIDLTEVLSFAAAAEILNLLTSSYDDVTEYSCKC